MSQQEMQPTERASSGAIVAAAMSIMYSLYLFYLRGNRQSGIFVGLWAPTILALSSYLEQTEMVEKMRDEV